MKSAKLFIVFTFLLAFAFCASAQNNQYPNEIEGNEFFKNGKLNDLKLLDSDRDDVKAIFGKNCDNGCDYNEDWKIGFSYVNAGWYKKFAENGDEKLYKPKPEFLGKLAAITFLPKRQILLLGSTVIPKEIKCNNGFTSRYNCRVCTDDKRVSYIISNETTTDGKVIKGQIISIDYVSSEKDDNEIYALVEK